MYIIIIITFDFVCDRLGSPSDLVKSWGGCDGRMQSTSAGSGLTGHSIILCILPVVRALLTALCLQVHTKGGKLRYKYSSARPHGHFSVSVPRNDVNGLLYMLTNEGVPESV